MINDKKSHALRSVKSNNDDRWVPDPVILAPRPTGTNIIREPMAPALGRLEG
jgi:hypothetical protein